MTRSLILHYAPDNASLCVRLVLEELDLPYKTALVDRSRRAQKDAAYLALNPNGLIPTLETPQGPIFETAAILLWLADTHPGRIFPATDATDRGAALSRLVWLSNTLHPTLRMLFYPDQFAPGAEETLGAQTRTRLCALFDQMDADHAHLGTDRPHLVACYLAPMLRWSALYGGATDWFDLPRWPRLHAFAKAFEARAAAKRAAAVEGLGPHPFSAPSPCTPPEGSPT